MTLQIITLRRHQDDGDTVRQTVLTVKCEDLLPADMLYITQMYMNRSCQCSWPWTTSNIKSAFHMFSQWIHMKFRRNIPVDARNKWLISHNYDYINSLLLHMINNIRKKRTDRGWVCGDLCWSVYIEIQC